MNVNFFFRKADYSFTAIEIHPFIFIRIWELFCIFLLSISFVRFNRFSLSFQQWFMPTLTYILNEWNSNRIIEKKKIKLLEIVYLSIWIVSWYICVKSIENHFYWIRSRFSMFIFLFSFLYFPFNITHGFG